jgi:hypothetical protein
MTFPQALATRVAAPGNGNCCANHQHGFPPGEFMTETVERAFRREKAAARIPASGNISLLGREEFADLGQGVIGEVVLERGFGSGGSVSRR